MTGVEFKDQNFVFGKPGDMTDEECSSLPVKKTTNGNFPAIESVWEFSDEELQIMMKSKRIRLGIIGHGIPPIYISAEL